MASVPELDRTTEVPNLAQSPQISRSSASTTRIHLSRVICMPPTTPSVSGIQITSNGPEWNKVSVDHGSLVPFRPLHKHKLERPGLHPHRLRVKHSFVERNAAECSIVCVGGKIVSVRKSVPVEKAFWGGLNVGVDRSRGFTILCSNPKPQTKTFPTTGMLFCTLPVWGSLDRWGGGI